MNDIIVSNLSEDGWDDITPWVGAPFKIEFKEAERTSGHIFFEVRCLEKNIYQRGQVTGLRKVSKERGDEIYIDTILKAVQALMKIAKNENNTSV